MAFGADERPLLCAFPREGRASPRIRRTGTGVATGIWTSPTFTASARVSTRRLLRGAPRRPISTARSTYPHPGTAAPRRVARSCSRSRRSASARVVRSAVSNSVASRRRNRTAPSFAAAVVLIGLGVEVVMSSPPGAAGSGYLGSRRWSKQGEHRRPIRRAQAAGRSPTSGGAEPEGLPGALNSDHRRGRCPLGCQNPSEGFGSDSRSIVQHGSQPRTALSAPFRPG